MDVTVVGALIEIKLGKKVLKQCCQSSYIVITAVASTAISPLSSSF